MRQRRLTRMLGLSLLVPVWAGCAAGDTPTYDLSRFPSCRVDDDQIDARRRPLAAQVEAALITAPVTATGWYGPSGELPQIELPDAGAGHLALRSYPDHPELAGRTYLYDQALALLWYAWTGERATARGLARTLIALQRDDGSFGFSFDGTTGFYDDRYVRHGAVAWAAHALTYQGVVGGDAGSLQAGRRAARYLADQRRPDGLVPAGRGAWVDDGRRFVDEAIDIAVAEHQFDVHMALASALPGPAASPAGSPAGSPAAGGRDTAEADDPAGQMEAAIVRHLWRDDHFRTAHGGPPAPDALDAAGSWGTMWLLSVGRHREALESLRYTIARFYVRRGSREGFRPYADDDLPDDLIFVEGSMGAGLAALRAGVPTLSRRMLRVGMELGCMTGAALPYANRDAPSFPATPSAAPSLWFLFLEREARSGRPAPLFPTASSSSAFTPADTSQPSATPHMESSNMSSRTRLHHIASILALGATLMWASPLEAACPEADEARTSGDVERAEQLARHCVARSPDDASAWMSLSRVLGQNGQHEEAMRLADRTIERHPDDPFPRLWKARLHYFAGRHDAAAEALSALPMATRGEPEVVLLRADVALAQAQHERASELYARYLESAPDDPNALYHRGLAYRGLQRHDEARIDLQRACEIDADSTEACGALVDLERNEGPAGYALILPGYFWVPDGVDGYTISGAIGYSPFRELSLEINAEYRARGFGDRGLAAAPEQGEPQGERLEDLILGTEAIYRFGERWSLAAGGSMSPDPEFVPQWTAFLEPGVAFGLGDAVDMQLRLRYWRIQFEPGGAHVIDPIVVAAWDRFALDLRYYLSVEDDSLRPGEDGDTLTHSGLARLYYYLGDVTHVFVGAGLGDRTDYLNLRLPDTEGYALATAGVRWEVVTSHSLIAEWIYRDEQAGDFDYEYHEFLLGYRKDVF